MNLASWRPSRLLMAWFAYWGALVLAVLGPMIPTLWRITRPDAKGSLVASVGDGAMQLKIAEGAATLLTREVSLVTASLWVAVPPLLLWIVWLRAQRRRKSERVA